MILARHILREHIAPFLYSLVTITGLFLMDFIVQVLDSILSKGLPWKVVLELFVLNVAWILALSVPMSVLVATLMAFGRLSADREIEAMQAAGIRPQRMILPVVIAGILVGTGLFFFNDRVLPEANYRAASLRQNISHKRPAVVLQPRTMIQDFDGFRIWIDRTDRGTDLLHGIVIEQVDPVAPPTVITARTGTVAISPDERTWIFDLRDGETHSLDQRDQQNYLRTNFKDLRVEVPNVDSRLDRSEKGYRGDREMSIKEMKANLIISHDRERGLKENAESRILDDLHDELELLAADSAAPAGSPELQEKARSWSAAKAPIAAVERFIGLCFSRENDAEVFESELQSEHHEQERYTLEIHKKFSIPTACLVFVLIGAPLGIMARSGGIGTGVSYSLAFFVVYWVCLIGGEAKADHGQLEPWIAMWFPNILMGAIGLFLVWRMGRPRRFSFSGLFRRRRRISAVPPSGAKESRA